MSCVVWPTESRLAEDGEMLIRDGCTVVDGCDCTGRWVGRRGLGRTSSAAGCQDEKRKADGHATHNLKNVTPPEQYRHDFAAEAVGPRENSIHDRPYYVL